MPCPCRADSVADWDTHIQLRDLPLIWDADFMLGPPGADGTDSYVLGEINVSSVFPIPDEAPAEIARRVADRLRSADGGELG